MPTNEKTLKEAIEELLKHYAIGSRLDQVKLIGSWPEKVGPMIAKHTRNLYIHHQCLYVELDSSVVRQELALSKSILLRALNEDFETPVIQDIVFK